jgi:hypothetical protein
MIPRMNNERQGVDQLVTTHGVKRWCNDRNLFQTNPIKAVVCGALCIGERIELGV